MIAGEDQRRRPTAGRWPSTSQPAAKQRDVGDREHRRERDRGLDRGRPLAGRERLERRAAPRVALPAAGVAARHRLARQARAVGPRRRPPLTAALPQRGPPARRAARGPRPRGRRRPVIARTTTIRRAPSATTAPACAGVEAADREPRRVRRARPPSATYSGPAAGRPGLVGVACTGPDGEVVDVGVGVGRRALRRRVRGAADDRVRARRPRARRRASRRPGRRARRRRGTRRRGRAGR